MTWLAMPRRLQSPMICPLIMALSMVACTSTTITTAQVHLSTQGWQAPLPHGGDPLALRDWWMRFDDPLVPKLIEAAQTNHPTMAQAVARIAQARADLGSSQAARWPVLSLVASANRQRLQVPPPPITVDSTSITSQASWEVDLFGRARHGVAAAQARVEGREQAWHGARVSLAAETAQSYIDYRACEALVALHEETTRSLDRNAELVRLKAKAGFEAPAMAALADASAAESSTRLIAQQADCDTIVKALVTLTGLPEPTLRADLKAHRGQLPAPAAFEVESLPAALIEQRPDVAEAESQLRAAAGDVSQADAARFPALLLSGSIGRGTDRVDGVSFTGSLWSIGPQLDLPLFDAGRRQAALAAARARFDEARASYELNVRQAIQETEQALVRLDASKRRLSDAKRAAYSYERHLEATSSQWKAGSGNLIDMENARRLALESRITLVGVQRDQTSAWVSLYRATGGGWARTDETPRTSQ